MQNKVINFQTH